jgi:hypothetical protein
MILSLPQSSLPFVAPLRAMALALLVAGCAVETVGDIIAVDVITIDGVQMTARQEKDWPSMIAPVSAETGQTEIVQSGTADTVIIGGSNGDRDLAIRALAQFCGQTIDPNGFDTQFVFKEPQSGDYWFDGWSCR